MSRGEIPTRDHDGHLCRVTTLNSGYGAAIQWCYVGLDGYLWVTNREYSSQAQFCPVCGYEAACQPEPAKYIDDEASPPD